jgi:hypothetical protein
MEHADIILEIEKLKQGEKFVVPESDYGKAEIWLINDLYFLFSIPAFGGTPTFERAFGKWQTEDMLLLMDSRT